MKQRFWIVAFCLVPLLCACGTTIGSKPQTTEPVTFAGEANPHSIDLKNWLPGFYSNYTQVIEAGGPADSVTDLTVRLLPVQKETVFLFESKQRGSAVAHYVLYFSYVNSKTGQLELHFSRLTGAELSMSMPETLAIARQRVLPGCVIELTSIDDKLTGASKVETCLFEDPLNGETALWRSMVVTSSHIELSNTALMPGDVLGSGTKPMDLQKQQAFEGNVSINTAIGVDDQDGAGWRKSININVYDDGRTNKLYDAEMAPMEYAIKLSRLYWRDNEPPYLRVEILHQKSGEALAYSWFDSDSEQIDWELDWVKVHLKELHLGSE